jgi:hypothetical protein
MRDQGLIIGRLGLGHRQLGLDPRRSFALHDQRRLQRGNVVGEVIDRRRGTSLVISTATNDGSSEAPGTPITPSSAKRRHL